MNDDESQLIPGVIALIGILMIIAGVFLGSPFWLACIITGLILLVVGSLIANANKR